MELHMSYQLALCESHLVAIYLNVAENSGLPIGNHKDSN